MTVFGLLKRIAWILDIIMFDKMKNYENLRKKGLNERQIKAVMYVKEKGRITNREYRSMFGITDRMALIDITKLCLKGIFEKVGVTGRKAEYILTSKTRNKPETNPKVFEEKKKMRWLRRNSLLKMRGFVPYFLSVIR